VWGISPRFILIAGAGLITLLTAVLAVWGNLPLSAILGLSLVCLSATIAAAGSSSGRWFWIFGWLGTLLVPAGIWAVRDRASSLDTYYAAMAWMVAASALLAAVSRPEASIRRRWREIGMTWAVAGGVLWLLATYVWNSPGEFVAGLVILAATLVVTVRLLRPPVLLAQILFGAALFLIALPVADVAMRPAYRFDPKPDLDRRYYSYDAAKRSPADFGRWWDYYLDQVQMMTSVLFTHEPGDVVPWKFGTNRHTTFFECPISINSRGFRGKEFSSEKGNAYRIVALGESTTFGSTMRQSDRPWPEVLEDLIRDRLRPTRPVEVINAGVPAYHLRHNLARLPVDILPLNPDMIISYHGCNGMSMLNSALPHADGPLPPAYKPRPLKLLADAEYHLRITAFKRKMIQPLQQQLPTFSRPLETDYAQAYRELITLARTNGIRLVLANFSMAVNRESDSGVVEFYRGGFPSVHWLILGNQAHSKIVEELARQNDGVTFVDTHTNLDGHYDRYVDLVHFTQEGRQQLAETMFAGIRGGLEKDLGREGGGK
jgi:lysophospholipase L1-like esterase